MAKQPYKDRLFKAAVNPDAVGTSGVADIPQGCQTLQNVTEAMKAADRVLNQQPPVVRSQANQRRLDTAIKHLVKMFEDAEAEQIDERRFWGRIVLEIPFENGSAQHILASKYAQDRCSGGKIS